MLKTCRDGKNHYPFATMQRCFCDKICSAIKFKASSKLYCKQREEESSQRYKRVLKYATDVVRRLQFYVRMYVCT
jgi:hypothetical protein